MMTIHSNFSYSEIYMYRCHMTSVVQLPVNQFLGFLEIFFRQRWLSPFRRNWPVCLRIHLPMWCI